MKELIKRKLDLYQSNEEKYSQLREYLQWLILRILEIKKNYTNIAFVGGTALRILYGLNRFSEDLDFSLINKNGYDFSQLLHELQFELNNYGLNPIITLKQDQDKIVNNSFIKFPDILYEFGLSSNKNQNLSIKLEIDTNPPAGYDLIFTPVNLHFLLNIRHFDLPSLFAGKLHALMCRPYCKGRDYYDLLWFISKKITPNYEQLSNAYFQTEHKRVEFDRLTIINILKERINSVNIENLQKDLLPFIIESTELSFFNKESLLGTIEHIDRRL